MSRGRGLPRRGLRAPTFSTPGTTIARAFGSSATTRTRSSDSRLWGQLNGVGRRQTAGTLKCACQLFFISSTHSIARAASLRSLIRPTQLFPGRAVSELRHQVLLAKSVEISAGLLVLSPGCFDGRKVNALRSFKDEVAGGAVADSFGDLGDRQIRFNQESPGPLQASPLKLGVRCPPDKILEPDLDVAA